MIESLHTWLLGVVLTAFAAALARQLVPKGREQVMVRFVSGLLMVLALLYPFLDHRSAEYDLSKYFPGTEVWSEEYLKIEQQELNTIIEDRIATYIWDKATGLGLDCTVSVDAAMTEGGVPMPNTVRISVPYERTLAEWIEEVVGIPADKQIWLEGE